MTKPLHFTFEFTTSSIFPKTKMSITETFYLAHKARGKLTSEASRPDHNLRFLVGHANLLDTLMLHLSEAEEQQEHWFNNTVRGHEYAEIEQEEEEEEEAYGPLATDYSDSGSESEMSEDEYEQEESEDEDEDGLYSLCRTTSRRPPSLCVDNSDDEEEDTHQPPSPPTIVIHHPTLSHKDRQLHVAGSYYEDSPPITTSVLDYDHHQPYMISTF